MKLIALFGPTAVGKTELALKVAEALNCPILNCDSRQIYKDIPIGTAAPTEDELRRVKHYFVGFLSITDYYSAARYEEDVLQLTEKLKNKYAHLLLTGGSMMYLDAVCKGIDDIPTVTDEVRDFLKKRLQEEGIEKLSEELKILDPEYYKVVDCKNPKRIVHALEICYTSGKTYSSFRKREVKERPFKILKIGLKRDRKELFERINQRVDTMIEKGLLDEVRRMYPFRSENALNTVGYKELFKYMDGEWDLTTAIERMKKNTRVYAKKQMTWFQHDPDTLWFYPHEERKIIDLILQEKQ